VQQYAKGLDTRQENRQEILKSLETVKHHLWHGNVARARDRIEDIHCFLDNEELTGENSRKLRKALDEFDTYVAVKRGTHSKLWRALAQRGIDCDGLCGIGGKSDRK
jgi:hypothetical protein